MAVLSNTQRNRDGSQKLWGRMLTIAATAGFTRDFFIALAITGGVYAAPPALLLVAGELSMTEILKDAVAQAPALVVLVILVFAFLRHLRSTADRESLRDKANAERDSLHADTLKDLHETCHTTQEKLVCRAEEAFDRVGQAIDKNTSVLAEASVRIADAGKPRTRRGEPGQVPQA